MKCDEINESLGTDYKDTDWHVDELFDQFEDLIDECGKKGGWYIGDAISVKIIVDYVPENK